MNGWLLDTNVIAELARVGGDARVAVWAAAANEDLLYISVLTLGEYHMGVANLPDASPARARIEASVASLEVRFEGRVLGVSDAIVRRWGRISGAVQRASRHPPPVIDTLLAATAIEYDLRLVTRNTKDVKASGATLFNPWQEDAAGLGGP